MTMSLADLHARGLTVVDGKVVQIAPKTPNRTGRNGFPDPGGSWCIQGIWHRAQRLDIDTEPLERGNQRQITEYLTNLECEVCNLSQFRPSAVKTGIPDLWVFGPPRLAVSFWWETKKPRDGAMSDDQVKFALNCERTGTLYGCGPASALVQFCQAIGLRAA